MMTQKHIGLIAGSILLALLGACAAENANEGPMAASQPFRADFNERGYAKILDAPPADYEPAPPAQPEPRTAEQDAADEQFMRVSDYQNSVRDEVHTLAERLRREEAENFVDLHFDNEGEPSVVFEFLRDGPQTLRSYSDNPTFRGVTVRWSLAELKSAGDYMWETFGEERVIQATGIGTQEVTTEISVAEAEFRALAKRKGAAIPEQVKLVFNAAPVVPLSNPPRAALRDEAVPAEIAKHIRIFPRHDRPAGPLNAINSQVKVVLKDGCFRAADQDDALILFPFGARLFVDGQNYLAFGDGERPGYARVGEVVVFMGSVQEIDTPELVDPIRKACGPGKVIKVEGLESASARNQQDTMSYAANALRFLQNNYGLDETTARRAYRWLESKQAAQEPAASDRPPSPSTMASSTVMSPPLPVAHASDCPAGTRLVSFVCRTPEGHQRPLPNWLMEFMEQDG